MDENELIEQIEAEIKKLGDNTKANYDELRRRYEELKSASNPEQMKKLATEITLRQEALDRKIDENFNTLKTAMKRTPLSIPGDDGPMAMPLNMEKKLFVLSVLSARNREEKGVTPEKIRASDVTLEAYTAYKEAFDLLLRMGPSPDGLKALSVGSDPDGGYTVTPQMSARIIARLFEGDPIRQLAGSENVTTGALEWLVDFSDVETGWQGDEKVIGGETATPQFSKKRIPVHEAYARPRATQTLLEDSGINIEAWLGNKLADKFLRTESGAFVTGDGVNRPRGFLTYPTYAAARVDEWGKIEQINMRAAAALTADGFIAVKYSLIEQFLTKATWLMNRLTVADAMYLKDGTGQYIWKPGFQVDEPATILSLPVRMSTSMPVVGVNALAVALADWAEFYMIVDRLGITIQRDPFTVKPFVEFYTRKRVGGDVVNFQAGKIGIIHV